jgi:hypothetical protein
VAEGGDGGVDGDVHCIAIEEDLDQSPEGPKANLANEGKPRFILNLFVYLNYAAIFVMLVHLRSGVDIKP